MMISLTKPLLSKVSILQVVTLNKKSPSRFNRLLQHQQQHRCVVTGTTEARIAELGTKCSTIRYLLSNSQVIPHFTDDI